MLIGDEGKDYYFMMKPNDLRKDFRLEFNAVVKEYLHKDPDAREKLLNVRTYAVCQSTRNVVLSNGSQIYRFIQINCFSAIQAVRTWSI